MPAGYRSGPHNMVRVMYPGSFATSQPNHPAVIMAATGQVITYAELEAGQNRLAHLLRAEGLEHLDHYSIFMENTPQYFEACGAGERAGLYYTCINSYLKADEVAYILNNSESRVLITSPTRLEVARVAMEQAPNVALCLVIDGDDESERFRNYQNAVAAYPDTPIDDEFLGTSMLYSSGTTGRPKGILRPIPSEPPSFELPLFTFLSQLWQYRHGMVYLSPAPLYHSAPQAANNLTIRMGGTAIVMERFDPEWFLSLVEQYSVTHTQLVPTMFSRMLKLDSEVRSRFDLSSLEFAVHAAAPCPVAVKTEMIEWWGPIIHEYYGATEGLGFAACNTEEWLTHPGTVGRIILGDLHILDEEGNDLPNGDVGEIWFETATEFEYFNDPERTQESRSADGSMSTVGDMGYVDDDGFLYLTDRSTFMIISGGVNIYPQETEDLLITHPKVYDAAVFGVPNEDLGEEVKAVIQLPEGMSPSDELTAELLGYCEANLSRQKVPRSIDFTEELPRLPTGKLYKRVLRDRYWEGRGNSRIL